MFRVLSKILILLLLVFLSTRTFAETATDSGAPSTIPNTPFPSEEYAKAQEKDKQRNDGKTTEADKVAKTWRDQNAAIDATNAQNAARQAQLKQGGGGGGGGHEGGGGQPPMMMPPPPPPPPPPPNNPPPPPPQPPPPSLPPPAALGPAQNDTSKTDALEKQIQEQKDLLAQMNSEKKSTSDGPSQTDQEVARIQENARLQQEKLVNDTIARIQANQQANTTAQSQIDSKRVAADNQVKAMNNATIADRMKSGSPVSIDLASNVPGQPGRAMTGSYASSSGTPNLPGQTNIRGIAPPPPPPPFPGRGVRIDGKGTATGGESEREPSSDNSSIFSLFGAASVDSGEHSLHFTGPMIISRDLKVALEANRSIVGGSTRQKRNILPAK